MQGYWPSYDQAMVQRRQKLGLTLVSASSHCIEACQDGINPWLMLHLTRLTRKKDEDYLVVLA